MAHAGLPNASSDTLRWLGYCRVELSLLNFEHPLFESHRISDERNVVRLVNIFRTEGCHREEEDNYIKGVADDEEIPNRYLLQEKPLDWGAVPCFESRSIDCLNGLHRALAARRYLQRTDRWWIVSLFSKDPSTAESLRVTEEFRNERGHSDGEIFRKIRQCHIEGDSQRENKWWARLTETKRKDLRQLLRDERYQNAFDSLLSWPGLWSPIRLGSLHRLLTMKCDEELLNYLNHIAQVWHNIFLSVSSTAQRETLDVQTVRHVEAKAPVLSAADRRSLEALFASNQLFPALTDTADRAILLNNLLSCSVLIPSLHTFFESLKYLEPCAKILRGLLPPKQRRSVRSALLSSFQRPETLELQYGLEDLRVHCSSTPDRDFELGYQQLWLYALRNFSRMTDVTPRKEVDRPKPEPARSCPSAWRRFAKLAAASGFKTAVGDILRQQESELVAAQELIDRFRPYSQNERSAREIAVILRASSHHMPPDCGIPTFTSNEHIGIERRFGRPYQTDHEEDAKLLYLPNMYRSPSPGPEITTFYCKWDMFRHFMGCEKMCPTEFSASRTPISEAQMASELDVSHRCMDCVSLSRRMSDTEAELAASNSNLQKANKLTADHDREIIALRQTVELLQNEIKAKDTEQEAAVRERANVVTVAEQELRTLRKRIEISETYVADSKRNIEEKTAKISRLTEKLRVAEVRQSESWEKAMQNLNYCEDFKRTAEACKKDMKDLKHEHAKQREGDAKQFTERIKSLEAALEQAKRNIMMSGTAATHIMSTKRAREPDTPQASSNTTRRLSELMEGLAKNETAYRIVPPGDNGDVCLVMRIVLVLATGPRQIDMMCTLQDAQLFVEGLAHSEDFHLGDYKYFVGLQMKRLLPSQTTDRSKSDALDLIWSAWKKMQVLLVAPQNSTTDPCPIGIGDEYISQWQQYGITVSAGRLVLPSVENESADTGGKRPCLENVGEDQRIIEVSPNDNSQEGTEQPGAMPPGTHDVDSTQKHADVQIVGGHVSGTDSEL